ncbi:DUF2877 domain-containing protein [Brevibacillus choshinensis]|uniref:DUF2877 domain-containing protein n=1 Tax=Brevibacillus choshinensis TaxID=54911 RepID=A0ABX7FY83_BRECH|nr:DUF2877 domain-containing protein [Brevibacillus choshinensis]
MHVRTLSGDDGFLRRVASGELHGSVHSLFDRTINIHCEENGELFTIACIELDNGPNTLVVDRKRFQNMGIAVNDPVSVKADSLIIGKALSLTWQHARQWECVLPVYPSSDQKLRENMAVIKEYVAAHGKSGGLKKASSPANVFEAEVSSLLIARTNELYHALAHGRWSEACEFAIGLVGLGPGLTPSGDDYLAGLFSVYHMPNAPCCLPYPFFEKFTRGAHQRTNEISYMMIKKAAIGHVRESMVRLLEAVVNGTPEEVVHSLGNVLGIGSSSGTDMAMGLISGLALQLEMGGNVCLSKS